jgi:hypothetical protein
MNTAIRYSLRIAAKSYQVKLRRSARLAKLPRISYAGMDCDE